MKRKGVFVAIDETDIGKAINLIKEISDYIYGVKVGYEFFYINGISGLKEIEKLGKPIFLDLKMFDIPNTVYKSLVSILSLVENIEFVTVHATGGVKMVNAAIKAVNDSTSQNTKILGITALTSTNISKRIKEAGSCLYSPNETFECLKRVASLSKDSKDPKWEESSLDFVLSASRMFFAKSFPEMHAEITKQCNAKGDLVLSGEDMYILSICFSVMEAEIGGFVCSAGEVATLKLMLRGLGDLKFITPGIRPKSYLSEDDQVRVATPSEAVANGADFLVIGRPITQDTNPKMAAENIYNEIQNA